MDGSIQETLNPPSRFVKAIERVVDLASFRGGWRMLQDVMAYHSSDVVLRRKF